MKNKNNNVDDNSSVASEQNLQQFSHISRRNFPCVTLPFFPRIFVYSIYRPCDCLDRVERRKMRQKVPLSLRRGDFVLATPALLTNGASPALY